MNLFNEKLTAEQQQRVSSFGENLSNTFAGMRDIGASINAEKSRRSEVERQNDLRKKGAMTATGLKQAGTSEARQERLNSLVEKLRDRGMHSQAEDIIEAEAKVSGYDWLKSAPMRFVAPYLQGVGDVASGAGAATEFIGDKFGGAFSGTAKKLTDFGTVTQENYRNLEVEQKLGEFDYGDLAKPEFYHQNLFRGLPFVISMLPAGYASFGAGALAGGAAAGAATSAGLGAFGSSLVGAISNVAATGVSSLAIQRSMEASIEGGQIYKEVLNKTNDKEMARTAGNKVFMNNLKLAGLDTMETLAAFTPASKIPFLKSSKLLKSSLVKTTGKVLATGAMEATEEILQDKFGKEAMGEEFSLSDPETQQAGVVGALMGGVMAGGGEIMSRRGNQTATVEESQQVLENVLNDVESELPAEIKNELAKQKEIEKSKGFDEKTSTVRALDKVTEKNKDVIDNILKKQIDKMKQETTGKTPEKVEQGKITDQKQLAEEMIKSRLNDIAMKVEKDITGKLGKSTPFGDQIRNINPSGIDSPGKFYSKVKTILDNNQASTPEILEGLKQTTKDFFIELKQDDKSVTFYEDKVEKEQPKTIKLTTEPKNEQEIKRAEREARVLSELEIAEAGKRVKDSEGKWSGIKSSFPEWVPSNLRRRKLFDSVTEHINKNTYPTKKAEKELYEVIREEIEANEQAFNELVQDKEINVDELFFGSDEELSNSIKNKEKQYEQEIKSIKKQDTDTKKDTGEEETKEKIKKAKAEGKSFDVRDKTGMKLQDPFTAKPLPINQDGTITVYHSTTKNNAEKIKQNGLIGSKVEGGDIYFTTNKKGYGGIGKDKNVVLAFNIDPKKLKFDDVFRGELHLKGNNLDIQGIKPQTKSQLKKLRDADQKAETKKTEPKKDKIKRVEGTGKERKSGLFQRLKKELPELVANYKDVDPTYTKIEGEKDIEISANYVKENYDKVFDVVMGREPIPRGARQRTLLYVLSTEAFSRNDIETVNKATRWLSLMGTEVAQELQAGRNIPIDSELDLAQKIQKEKMKVLKDKDVKTEIEKKSNEILKEVNKNIKNTSSAQEMIDSLMC